MSDQLALDLPIGEALGREDYLITPSNALAASAIQRWRGWPLGKAILVGPEGSGKSHLAAIWARETGARLLTADDLAEADVPDLAARPLALEEADRLPGRAAEEALFHLHNLMAERRMPLLLTARTPPRDWRLQVADLASRMEGTTVFRLEAPDDELLRGVLAKLFADRQLAVHGAIMDWLAARMTRSLATARRVVADLDARALAEMAPVSRQMAADWLEQDLQGDLDL